MPHGIGLRDVWLFQTSVDFNPTLVRQRDHAASHGQPERAALFEGLIQRVDGSRT